MNWDKLEFTNHEKYFKIAREYLQIAQETDSDLYNKLGVSSYSYQSVTLKIEDSMEMLQGLQVIDKSNIFTIVFAALTAESFINYYALSNGKDEAYLKGFKADKKLGLGETVMKWIKIPNDLVRKFALTQNSTEVNNLQKLFSDRNKLAHHKASIQDIASLNWSDIQDPNSIQLGDAQSA